MSQLTELLKKKNWRIWLKALLRAGIGGGAGGIVAALTTAQPSFRNIFLSGLITAAVGVFHYIEKSPMPEWEEDEQ